MSSPVLLSQKELRLAGFAIEEYVARRKELKDWKGLADKFFLIANKAAPERIDAPETPWHSV